MQVTIAKVDDLEPGSGMVVQVGEKKIALFNVDGNFFCIDNACKHKGGPLGDGELRANIVTCPWHGWEYNVLTGQSEVDPNVCVARYDVTVDGDEITINLPEN